MPEHAYAPLWGMSLSVVDIDQNIHVVVGFCLDGHDSGHQRYLHTVTGLHVDASSNQVQTARPCEVVCVCVCVCVCARVCVCNQQLGRAGGTIPNIVSRSGLDHIVSGTCCRVRGHACRNARAHVRIERCAHCPSTPSDKKGSDLRVVHSLE